MDIIIVWDRKLGPSVVPSSDWFLVYFRNCIPIDMESPFFCKAACNVSMPGKFDRDLSNT